MPPKDFFGDGKIRLIVRTDDIGMCHAVNEAFARVAREGIVTAASVMLPCPWVDEAVEILAAHPRISAGVHATVNSEWAGYRWGPVLGPHAAPTLVDAHGKFHPTAAQVHEAADADEVEREIEAQVQLAKLKGLRLSYMDHHMFTLLKKRPLLERLESVAGAHGLALSGWFGEWVAANIYTVPSAQKAEALIDGVRALAAPGLYLLVAHPGLDVPELRAMRDLNPGGLPDMAAHRQAETDALCDPRLRDVIEEKGIELVGYDMLREKFLQRMTRPKYAAQ